MKRQYSGDQIDVRNAVAEVLIFISREDCNEEKVAELREGLELLLMKAGLRSEPKEMTA